MSLSRISSDRDKYIGRIDVPDGDENPENIYIRLAPWTFGFSATAYASEELASLYDQERDQRYLLYFTKYLGGIDLDYPSLGTLYLCQHGYVYSGNVSDSSRV